MIKKSLIMMIIIFCVSSSYSVQNKIDMNMKYIDTKIRVNHGLEDSILLIKTASKHLDECNNLLQKSREILVKGANGIYTKKDRENMIIEILKNVEDYNFIIEKASFNNIFIFHNGKDKFNTFKIILSEFEDSDTIIFNSPNYEGNKNIISQIGENLKPTPDNFDNSISKIDHAIFLSNKERALLGSFENQINNAIRFNKIFVENQYDKNKIIKKLADEKEHFFSIEDRIYSLAVQGAIGIYNNEDRIYIDIDYQSQIKEYLREQKICGIQRILSFPDSVNLLTQENAEKEMKRISLLLKKK